MDAPKGYTYVSYFLRGSNVSQIEVLVCDKCGCLVGSPYVHTSWHSRNPELRPIGG